jgi:hypothetical protein
MLTLLLFIGKLPPFRAGSEKQKRHIYGDILAQSLQKDFD